MSQQQQQQQQQGSSPSGSGRDRYGGSSSGSKRTRTMKPLPEAHLAALRGRYELLSVRGKGSFAEVWEARHLRTGHRVAIKILSHDTNKPGATEAKDGEREIRVMRLLRHHPHIVRFHQAIRGHGHTYIVMELAESGQLHDHVAVRERLPEAQARGIFQQLAAAVAYCHHNMVAHRDLKMENVLLGSGGDVKVVDFGFSKLFRYTKLQSESCGSREYAAPELLEGRRYMGPEVDVWSCGVILYGMLCGRLPFDGAHMSDLSRNIRRGEYRLPSWVSDDARDLISSMLIVRPEKRATIGEVRAHRWLQLDMPPYLAAPPFDATTHQAMACMRVDDAAVELLVARHGFERSTQLLESLHLEGSEAAVAYQLVLSKQYDAATRYQQVSTPPPPPPLRGRQWALGGLDGELLLHDCPRETMRRVGRALGELGIWILFYSSHRTGHRMVCAHVVPPPATIRSFLDDDAALEMSNGILESLSAAVFFHIQVYKAAAGEGEGEGTRPPERIKHALHIERISGRQLRYLRVCSQLQSKLRSNLMTHH